MPLTHVDLAPWAVRWARALATVAPWLILGFVLGAGCETAPGQDTTFPPQEAGEFQVIDEGPDGFTLAVNYRRYQFVPQSASVASACRIALVLIARELAELRGHKPAPIDEKDVQLTIGRDNATAMTTCSATIPVKFVD